MKKFEDIEVKDTLVHEPPEIAVSKIFGYIKSLYNEIDWLKRKLEPYEKGTHDNELIQKLQEENRKLRDQKFFQNDFNFSEEDFKKGSEWCSSHYKTAHSNSYGGVSGGSFTWSITPTGLGIIKNVKCSCGECCDLTTNFG